MRQVWVTAAARSNEGSVGRPQMACENAKKTAFSCYSIFIVLSLSAKKRKLYAQNTALRNSQSDLVFLFWNTDFNENRAHVHVGKKSTDHLCKIWLEPTVELSKQGDLSDAQVKEVMRIASEYKDKLLRQWSLFKEGKPIRMIKVNK